jgi:hypothetical protein
MQCALHGVLGQCTHALAHACIRVQLIAADAPVNQYIALPD